MMSRTSVMRRQRYSHVSRAAPAGLDVPARARSYVLQNNVQLHKPDREHLKVVVEHQQCCSTRCPVCNM